MGATNSRRISRWATNAVSDQWAARSASGQVKAITIPAAATAKHRMRCAGQITGAVADRCSRQWPPTTAPNPAAISNQAARCGSQLYGPGTAGTVSLPGGAP